ncbi:MipA/OmpV family protein [Flocculibacter collagenilyticus]|uniref:MipA/OmpV family protein n=1 Tax=Flocculibacter collagenilyticus TaxID=2744479 RepID=UPI0018F5AEDB|nr:MipA/OmpV family protein [Flocculibacter collagenilyticus]
MKVLFNFFQRQLTALTIGLFVSLLTLTPNAVAYQLDLGMGAFALSMPDYLGSDQSESYLLPLPYFYYKDENVKIDRNGFTGELWQSDNWRLDLSASAGVPVNSDDNQLRKGMPDLDWTFEGGVSLKYFINNQKNLNKQHFMALFAHKVIATDFTYLDDEGWRGGLNWYLQQPITVLNQPNISWATRVNINFADKQYLNYFYGVTPQQRLPFRPCYQAEAGYAGSDVSTGLVYKNKKLWLGGFVKYYNFSGSKQIDSPLMAQNHNWTIGIGAMWIFYSKRNNNYEE